MNETLENTRRMAADALERATNSMKDLRSGVSDRASSAQRYMGEYASMGKSYVTENPMRAALVAAAIGAAVAGLVIALRHRRELEDRYF